MHTAYVSFPRNIIIPVAGACNRLHFALSLFLSLLLAFANAQNKGLLQAQDPATLPRTMGAIPRPTPKTKTTALSVLKRTAANEFAIIKGWEMRAATGVPASPKEISSPGFPTANWYNATVPGTVLTTLVDRGVYPDPYWGLNNLYIPDTLCRQNWWYRVSFRIPADQKGQECWLEFKGINYAANYWLNGRFAGSSKGAFKRSNINVTSMLRSGAENVLAVEILPPPHPGIPHEQSVLAGRGPNGGLLCLDGPTFISSEGWDWVPGIRDRNIGIWQDVTLRFTGPVTLEDPRVITDLDLPDTSHARILISTTIHNNSNHDQQVILSAKISGININLPVSLAANETKEVRLSPRQFPQLDMQRPRLWWPNGYGQPNLYSAEIAIKKNAAEWDRKTIRFGIRELTYEMSLFHPIKHTTRVELNPTKIYLQGKELLFNNTARHKITGETVVPEFRNSADADMLEPLADTSTAPYLVIRVNGMRIFCKGGNWGMDDGMKRTSRRFLEPYFKLSRDANFTMIRNWTGESTEELFYDLCDEYGLLVWNDFWTSTENYNVMPEDNALLLDNARDVLKRFRNHPSIAIWCPRNEGYLPDSLDTALAGMIAKEDGTRHYQPNSRYMNLRTSGPWNYIKNPSDYYTRIADGFSTELGTTSVPTIRTMRKMMAPEDLWPIGDVWHYHDFHFGQKDYVKAIDSLYGNAENAEDFCRKAQLVNYDSHRAMFESWNSKLWHNASGMLIWMSHPAWPSTVWQAYSYDYETFGSFYGCRDACEPIHIQQNLHDRSISVINTTLHDAMDMSATLGVYSLEGRELFRKTAPASASANRMTYLFTPEIPVQLPSVYLVRLLLADSKGNIVSRNDYWKSTTDSAFRAFNQLPAATLSCTIDRRSKSGVELTLKNGSNAPCIGVKINLRKKDSDELILPAYCSEGYFNLLPGETRKCVISFESAEAEFRIMACGYNLKEMTF